MHIKNIRIEIDEIVFNGFENLDKNSVRSEIEHELSLLISDHPDFIEHSTSINIDDVNNNNNNNNDYVVKNSQQNAKKSRYQKISDINSGNQNIITVSLGNKTDSKSIGREIGNSIFNWLASSKKK